MTVAFMAGHDREVYTSSSPCSSFSSSSLWLAALILYSQCSFPSQPPYLNITCSTGATQDSSWRANPKVVAALRLGLGVTFEGSWSGLGLPCILLSLDLRLDRLQIFDQDQLKFKPTLKKMNGKKPTAALLSSVCDV